jgi:hypothetical protein
MLLPTIVVARLAADGDALEVLGAVLLGASVADGLAGGAHGAPF